MAEWLYEEGIGEARAALIADGAIVEAHIETGDGPRVGAVLAARLGPRQGDGGRAIVRLDDGGEALLGPIPPGIAEGAALHVEVIREAIAEPGVLKPPNVRFALDGGPDRGPALLDRVVATGIPVLRPQPHAPDALEAAGWSELLDEARTGLVPFEGGLLRIALTPAMTLIDIDGDLPPGRLAVAGAGAAALAIRRFGLAGSIGIDLPTAGDKAARQAAAAAIDAALPLPFERTAVNGFGFVQIVRPRARMSLPELIAADPAGAAARALLRAAERSSGRGALTLVAHPAVASRIDGAWLAALQVRAGRRAALRADPRLAISAGHVVDEHP